MIKKLILSLLLLGCCLNVQAADRLVFAMNASYAPFEFLDPKTNQLAGFDVDLAKALCQELGVTCEFSNQQFDGLIMGLRLRRFDAIISGMDITPERMKQVDFTKPYYANSAQFIVRKGTFNNPAELAGKRIGVENGTTHQKYLSDKHKEMQGIPYSSYQNAILDLRNGRLDAIFGDNAVLGEWLKDGDVAYIGDRITDPQYFGIGMGIAVRKGNTELLQKLNNALDKLKQDGTYQQLYQKWF